MSAPSNCIFNACHKELHQLRVIMSTNTEESPYCATGLPDLDVEEEHIKIHFKHGIPTTEYARRDTCEIRESLCVVGRVVVMALV